ncbi:MAG: hypothetical protein LBL36_06860 [Clostridiales Family XIII bacterium]|jgi:TRAP-type C4-dicarboxylate transport system substrate-binding protein|nr:hypothetical protein [Clostridiales Family XIII bacterium]
MKVKKIFVPLLISVMLIALTACGSSSDPGGEEQVSTEADLPVSYELAADAQTRADDAYAFIAELKDAASAYDANAAKYSYTLNCHDPADSAVGEFLYAWSDAVLAATNGDVFIEVGVSNAFSAGGTMATLDDMKNGLIDFDFTLPCYFKGYMPYTLAIQNPALKIKNSTAGASAMWELYKNNTDVQAEYADDGETLFVWANNPSPLSYKGSAELSKISEVKGNIRANNGPAQMFVEQVGASVYSCPIGEVYTNVSTGVINYLVTDWHAVKSFSLYDSGVLDHYIDTNIGSSAYTLMANTDSWAAIEANGYADAIKSVSGDYFLNWIGIWEQYEIDARETATANGGDIYAPSGALAAELDAAYTAVATDWIAQTGGNAQAVYDQAASLVEKYNALYN